MLLEEHLREKLSGFPDGWWWYRVECIPPGQEIVVIKYTGAVAPLKKDGKPNWRKMDKATKREVYISVADHETWVKAWELRTGLCRTCAGDGKVFASWNIDTGTKMAQCGACSGTGKKAAACAAGGER